MNPIQITKTLSCSLAAVALMTVIPQSRAETLTAVSMQGGMVMPMVAYHADSQRLHVMMPSEVPQLTPLRVSNPGDTFDPADPWFDALDPGRHGLSFSRRYGFVMDTMTDLLPPNTSIWIRKISSSPELGFYRYSASPPKAWEAIFGTDGAPAARHWNGMMFHPGITAPPGTAPLTATFELFLAATDTGEELADTNSGPLVFDFTNVSDGRPVLEIHQKIIVAWPASATGFSLESAASADATTWTAVTNAPILIDGQPSVVLGSEAATKIFRMRETP